MGEEFTTTAHQYKMNWKDHVLWMFPDKILRKMVRVCLTWEEECESTEFTVMKFRQAEMPEPGYAHHDERIVLNKLLNLLEELSITPRDNAGSFSKN